MVALGAQRLKVMYIKELFVSAEECRLDMVYHRCRFYDAFLLAFRTQAEGCRSSQPRGELRPLGGMVAVVTAYPLVAALMYSIVPRSFHHQSI